MRHAILTACILSFALASAASAHHPVARYIRRHTSPEARAAIRQAAAAVRADLREIKSGGYVTRDQVEELARAVQAAAGDRELTGSEKQALSAMAHALAEQVPQELRTKLKGDADALVEAIKNR